MSFFKPDWHDKNEFNAIRAVKKINDKDELIRILYEDHREKVSYAALDRLPKDTDTYVEAVSRCRLDSVREKAYGTLKTMGATQMHYAAIAMKCPKQDFCRKVIIDITDYAVLQSVASGAKYNRVICDAMEKLILTAPRHVLSGVLTDCACDKVLNGAIDLVLGQLKGFGPVNSRSAVLVNEFLDGEPTDRVIKYAAANSLRFVIQRILKERLDIITESHFRQLMKASHGSDVIGNIILRGIINDGIGQEPATKMLRAAADLGYFDHPQAEALIKASKNTELCEKFVAHDHKLFHAATPHLTTETLRREIYAKRYVSYKFIDELYRRNAISADELFHLSNKNIIAAQYMAEMGDKRAVKALGDYGDVSSLEKLNCVEAIDELVKIAAWPNRPTASLAALAISRMYKNGFADYIGKFELKHLQRRHEDWGSRINDCHRDTPGVRFDFLQ